MATAVDSKDVAATRSLELPMNVRLVQELDVTEIPFGADDLSCTM